MHNNDEIMKKMADEYIEHYGQALRQELLELEQAEPDPEATVSGLRMHRRVSRSIAAEKRRPYLRALPLLAACIVIAVIFLPNLFGSNVSGPSTLAPATPAPGTLDSSDQSASGAAPAPAAPGSLAPSAPGAPDPGVSESEFEGYAIIPLSAPLPRGFTQIGFDTDRGKSIYYIEDANLDNVVITLEYADSPQDTSGLVEIHIGSSVVYGRQTDAFSLLTFSSDDVLYTLTSRHDINTLLHIGSAFI